MKKNKPILFSFKGIFILFLCFYFEASAELLLKKNHRTEMPAQTIVVARNPEQTETWVQLSEPARKGDQWEVLDANGKLIEGGKLDSACVEFSLNTGAYSSGSYIVNVFDEKNKSTTELTIFK